jgi:murein L,D-transpeptidase YcbB/YkuD
LRQALLKARSAGQTKADADDPSDISLPEGPSLRLGVTHPQVAILRRRLKTGASGDPHVFDEPLDAAVKAFQKEQGYLPDGIVGPRSRTILNGQTRTAQTGGTSEVDRVVANMERWRWMPEDLGDLYVWDNVPEFFMRVVKKGKMIHSAKIVVGKPDTQTPVFSADMRYIVFHPEWGVPNSIKVKEILPYLRPTSGDFFGFGGTDTRVLERHKLRVAYNGRPVDARSVDWSSVDIRQFTFIQPAGPDNVLGVVKFRFPNKHDVYMHDTPQRDLFDKQVRTYSHGCMRVQDPQRLAEVLLAEDKGWSAAQVRGLFSEGQTNEVELTRRIPVHVTYFTAMVGDDGTLRSIGDPYGHDRRVLAALAGRPMPLEQLHDGSDSESLRVARQPRPKSRDFGPNNLFSGLFGN